MPSVLGGIRSQLVGANLTGVEEEIYRDLAPPETPYPYITLADEITNQPVLLGDKTVIARNRQVRVNLWQKRTEENVELVDDLVATLDSANISANRDVFRVRVFEIQRIFDSEDDIVLHAVTLNVIHKAS